MLERLERNRAIEARIGERHRGDAAGFKPQPGHRVLCPRGNNRWQIDIETDNAFCVAREPRRAVALAASGVEHVFPGYVLRGEHVSVPMLGPDFTGAFGQETLASKVVGSGHGW